MLAQLVSLRSFEFMLAGLVSLLSFEYMPAETVTHTSSVEVHFSSRLVNASRISYAEVYFFCVLSTCQQVCAQVPFAWVWVHTSRIGYISCAVLHFPLSSEYMRAGLVIQVVQNSIFPRVWAHASRIGYTGCAEFHFPRVWVHASRIGYTGCAEFHFPPSLSTC
jgi:hypothetical protein